MKALWLVPWFVLVLLFLTSCARVHTPETPPVPVAYGYEEDGVSRRAHRHTTLKADDPGLDLSRATVAAGWAQHDTEVLRETLAKHVKK
jgi:hypothetical protein